MKRKILISLLMSFVFALTACGLKPITDASVSSYTLSSVNTERMAKKARKQSILVSMPIASPGYETSNMVYVDSPYQLKHYTRNKWVAPPQKVLLPLIAESLRNTHVFHAVVTPPFAGLADLRLDTQLLMLEQEFTHHPSQTRIIIEAELINNHTHKIIASRRFEATEAAPHDNPYGGVIAANRATKRIMHDLAAFAVKSST